MSVDGGALYHGSLIDRLSRMMMGCKRKTWSDRALNWLEVQLGLEYFNGGILQKGSPNRRHLVR